MEFTEWLINENWENRYQFDDSPKDITLVNKVVSEIRANVLPETPIANFEVRYVKGLKNLGKFVRGSSASPIILLCLGTIKRSCARYNVDLRDGIISTIMHELGHAIQELTKRKDDEKEAENFAHSYWRTGRIWNFWGQ